jgi:hypothetical protein
MRSYYFFPKNCNIILRLKNAYKIPETLKKQGDAMKTTFTSDRTVIVSQLKKLKNQFDLL